MRGKRMLKVVVAVAAAGFLSISAVGAAATVSGDGAFAAGEPHRTALLQVIESIGAEAFLTPPGAAPAR